MALRKVNIVRRLGRNIARKRGGADVRKLGRNIEKNIFLSVTSALLHYSAFRLSALPL